MVMAQEEFGFLKYFVYGYNISAISLASGQRSAATMLYDDKMTLHNEESCIIQICTCAIYKS